MRHGRRKWTESGHKILFQSRSISNRNASIGAKGLREGSEKIKRFLMVFLISSRKGAGRKWWERWPSKIDSNWDEHWCCFWFVQKWPSNRIKNDSGIFEHPQDYFFGFWKRIWERESCVHVLFNTAWHLSKGKIESHLAETLSRWPMQTSIFLNEIFTGDESWCFVYDPKTKRQSSEWVGETCPRSKELKF